MADKLAISYQTHGVKRRWIAVAESESKLDGLTSALGGDTARPNGIAWLFFIFCTVDFHLTPQKSENAIC